MAASGSDLAFANSSSLWSPLIEKAYAQLVEQSAVTAGAQLNVNEDSYAAISGGWDNGVTAITGQSTQWQDVAAALQVGDESILMQSIAYALRTHDDVLLATGSTSVEPDLLTDHMYAVIGANASADTVTLFNPWNSAAASESLDAVFTVSLATLGRDAAGFYIASGAAAAR